MSVLTGTVIANIILVTLAVILSILHGESIFDPGLGPGFHLSLVFIFQALFVILAVINVKSHLDRKKDADKNKRTLAEIAENLPGVFFLFTVLDSGERKAGFTQGRADKYFGIGKDDDIIERLSGMLMPEYAEGFSRSLKKAVENVKEWSYEGRIATPSGEKKWIDIRARAERKDDGVVFHGVILDITQVKQTEDLLRESEEKYWTLFDRANDGIFLMEDGVFVRCNRKIEELFGCDKSLLIGKTPEDISPPMQPDRKTSKDKAGELIKNVISGVPQLFQWEHIKFDGTVIETEISLSRVRFKGHVYIQAILRDITLRKRAEEVLLKNEERLRLALEATSDAIWDWDLARDKAYFSPRWLTMLGYEPDAFEHCGETWKALIHPDDLPFAWEEINRSLEEGEGCDVEYRMKTADGSWKWVRTRGKVTKRDEKGRPARMSGANTDVTDRKDAENSLRASEENLRITLNSIADAVIVTDKHGFVSRMNPMAEVLTGWPRKDALGRNVSEIFHIVMAGGEETPLENPVHKVLRTGRTVSFGSGLMMIDKLGAKKSILESSAPIMNIKNEIMGAVLIFRDVSAENALQEKLRASEEIFRTIFEASPYAISIRLLEDGKTVSVNPAYERLVGFSSDELVGRDLAKAGVVADAEARKKYNTILREAGHVENARETLRCKNREEKEILFSSVVVEFQGKPCVVTMTLDMTRERQLEEQLRQSQKMEALGHLAGGVAHDFNNMLTLIIGTAEILLAEQEKDSVPSRHTKAIVDAASRSSELTKNLLAFSRKGKHLSTPVDVHDLIKSCVILMERSFDRKIRVVTKLAASATVVEGDPSLLQNAIMNLALNARDAMPHGGTLTLSTSNATLGEDFLQRHPEAAPGRHAVLEVKDTGIGMSEEVLRHIFEPFFTTKEVGEGTGLGLSAVYGTVNEHKGAVEVESLPGKGSVFRLYLPALNAPVPEKDAENPSPVSGSGLVLVVDDEPGIRSMCSDILSSLGYDVVMAEDGEEAVKIYKKKADQIGMVVMDMIMPKMNGREAFLAIRKIDPAARVVFVSGYTRSAGIQDLFDIGAAGFIEKPFHVSEFSKAVAEAMRPRRPVPGDAEGDSKRSTKRKA